MALPSDLPIFLRSGSRIHPEMAAWRHGSTECSSSERTIVENSQVRMISCAWGRRSIGKTFGEKCRVLLPLARDLG